MSERIRNHVESLFEHAPRTRSAVELREELVSNLTERYNDLVAQGKDEESAYNIVISGIGDTDELIRGLHEQESLDPMQIQMQRQKSALLISVAVAIYIVSFIFPILFSMTFSNFWVAGVVLMFICWAVATMLLVYNGLSRPKYVKAEETLVEDFKEWNSRKIKKSAVRKSVNSLIWMLTLVIYLALGLFCDLWHPGWMVFPLAAVITHIIKLVSVYRGDDR